MASSSSCIPILFLLAVSCTRGQSHGGGHITAEISSRGIEFLKDLLVEKAEYSLVPLDLPDIETSAKIPLVGKVRMSLSNITIERIHLTSSTVETGNSGIVVSVSGATANLSMNWEYSYKARFIPISISDKGTATVQVEGLEVGVTVSLKTVGGSLDVALLKCGCHVNNIFIKLVGGASWLYQWLVDAFQGKISSAVEDSISMKINNTIMKLDPILQSIPKEVAVTNTALLNVTFVGDPELNESSAHVEIDGLFSAKHQFAFSSHYRKLQEASFSCEEASKMVKVSVHEDVLKSASSVYFEANKMNWFVDKLPNDKVLLNTTWWSFIIPQLYRLYPNRAMNLNLSVSSLPNIKVEERKITTTIPFDMVIDVLDGGEAISVACISSVISSSLFARFSGTTLTGTIKLNGFSMNLKWSKIGNLHMNLLQGLTSTVLQTLVLPYANLKLDQGYQVPAFHGFGLQDAHITFGDSWIVVCSDVAPMQYHLPAAAA